MKRVESFLITFLALNYFGGFSQCINLKGITKEDVTGNPVAVSISVLTENGKLNLGKSNEMGEFNVELPCDAKTINFEKKNFRPLSLPLNNNTGLQNFFGVFSMVPLDKQSVDKPYEQSEQKDFVLNNNAKEKNNEKVVTRIFRVIDAYSKEQINAKVCLFYTKKEGKNCIDISKKKEEKIVFKEPDIIAFEVESKGFQNYYGNLIIKELDNTSALYEIALIKKQTMLLITIPEEEDITNLDIFSKNIKKAAFVIKERKFYVNLEPNEDYTLKIGSLKKKEEKNIVLSEGINFLVIKNTTEVPIEKLTVDTPSQNIKHTIYFDQSDYNLNKISKNKLDSISKILIDNIHLKVQLIGYTDNVGNPQINETLSEYRAKVTLNYFTSHGVAANRISWIALGSKNAINANDTEENKSKNRRVEIKITDEKNIQK